MLHVLLLVALFSSGGKDSRILSRKLIAGHTRDDTPDRAGEGHICTRSASMQVQRTQSRGQERTSVAMPVHGCRTLTVVNFRFCPENGRDGMARLRRNTGSNLQILLCLIHPLARSYDCRCESATFQLPVPTTISPGHPRTVPAPPRPPHTATASPTPATKDAFSGRCRSCHGCCRLAVP